MQSLVKRIGVGNIISFIIILSFASYFTIRHYILKRNGILTKGIIIEQDKGARDHKYIRYTFQLEEKKFTGSVPLSFFKYCNYSCCSIDDTVIVRYNKANPKQNDLTKSGK